MARTEACSIGIRCPDACRARCSGVPLVDAVYYCLWLRRRVSGQVFLWETGDAMVHVDARASDSKVFAQCAVDIVKQC